MQISVYCVPYSPAKQTRKYMEDLLLKNKNRETDKQARRTDKGYVKIAL